jgi:DNA helicase-2/ATP-dependent DNA helicase PcrA
MTRAKDDLHLLVPQRFFVHGQASKGDRPLYASRTRFITEVLLPNFEKITWPVVSDSVFYVRSGSSMDIQAHMRRMWR